MSHLLSATQLREEAYLSPGTKLEPLVDRWPAWPHLIPPAQFALNLARRLLPLLRSFVANPNVHCEAARDPALFGGPFVALSVQDVATVQSLLARLEADRRDLLQFESDLASLRRTLRDSADGFSLDCFHEQMPESLAGLFELVYDLNDSPKALIFEDLSYQVMGARRAQGLCLHAVDDCEREFFMNTPLLETGDRIFFDANFRDPIVEALAKSRLQPGIVEDVVQRFESDPGLSPGDFFTLDEPVRRDPQYSGDGVRMRYFGHACVLMQTAKSSVLIDPATAWQRDNALASLTFNDLPDFIDVVAISHCHQDHLVAETLLQLRGRIGTIVVPPNDRGNLADPSMRLILRELGFENVRVLDHFESLELADGGVMSIPFTGEHGGLDIASKHALLVTLRDRRALFMVDSDAIDPKLSERIAERVGPIATVFLGMECAGAPMSWLYGPLFSKPPLRKNDQSRRFSGSDCERAWSAVTRFGCRRAFVYAMGQEPWMRHLMGLEYEPDSVQLVEAAKFVARCENNGIEAKRLFGTMEQML